MPGRLSQIPSTAGRLALYALPFAGLAAASIVSFLAAPAYTPVWAAAALISLWLLIGNNRKYLKRNMRARAACFVLILPSVFTSGLDRPLVAIAAIVAYTAAVCASLADYRKNGPGGKTAAGFAAAAVILLLTLAGSVIVKDYIRINMYSGRSCDNLSPRLRAVTRNVGDVPYDVFLYGENKIVTGFNGVYFFGPDGRRRKRPEFGAAVFSHYIPETGVLAGGGKGTFTAFVYDLKNKRFLFKKKIGKSDIIDVDYYNGSYYLLSESGNIVLINGSDYSMRIIPNLLIYAYALKINRETGKLYISSWGSGIIQKLDARTFEPEGKIYLLTPVYTIDTNDAADTVMATLPVQGKILEFNGGALSLKRRIRADIGARDIQYDPVGKAMHVASFIKGTYTKIDYESGRTVRRDYTGPDSKGIYYDPATKRRFAVSRCGVFEIR